MSRVIQDSDDDEDEASPLKPDHERHSSYNQQNARPGDDSTSPETRRSSANTSSTDILKRQIQDAQRELVDTTQNVEQPSPAHLDLMSSSTLAAMQRNKRRNSLTDMGSTEPPLKKPQRSKTVKTYASRQRRVEVDYTGGQLDALVQSQSSTHGGNTVMADQSTEDGTCTLQDIDGNGKLLAEASSGLTRSWGLPGSMAEQFAAHEPGAMFEDPSSTIPENTLEQQRLVEEALLANAERPARTLQPLADLHTSSSSIPWSTSVATQSQKSSKMLSDQHLPRSMTVESPSQRTSRTETHNYTTTTRPSNDPIANEALVPPLEAQDQGPDRSCPSVARSKTQVEVLIARSNETESAEAPTSAALSNVPESGCIEVTATSTPGVARCISKSNKRTVRAISEVDELASDSFDIGLPKEQYKPRPSRSRSTRATIDGETADKTMRPNGKKGTAEAEVLNSDDMAIGLPTEQYRPRPTRSSSARMAVEESTSSSVVHARRGKVAGVSSGLLFPEESEKIETLSSMGFSASQSRKALEEAQGSVDNAVELLCERNAESTHAAPTSNIAGIGKTIAGEVSKTVVGTQDSLEDDVIVRPRRELKSNTKARQEEDDPESVKENGTTSTVASQASTVSKQQSEASGPLQEWSQRPPNELEAVEIVHMRPPDTKRKMRITKPVRSKTTIFEDHVGFGGNPPTASLQQQQALRKSSQASDTIEGGRDGRAQTAESSVAPTKGKRRRVVQLKEIDEHAPEDASATEPPKKRGRGRPRSVQKPQEAQEEVTEVVVEDSATVDQQLSQSQLQEVEVNTASQKTTLDTRNVMSSETARSKELSGTPPNTAAESASSVAKPLTDATIMTPQKPGHATSPTSHSPLKASNKVPLRVGLSRRQRIPSLLRLVKK
ncbi:hypothetical protein B0A49_04715 [Cryomyces minteri]|uniref:UBA domain-containing protein n=1 Tax=Cryomyces minteri TaxID=331657 RepID=A0A4U0XDT1_9PEZI|nr:hypothetical protein B0A49_04715 [Cryomyces minteri]